MRGSHELHTLTFGLLRLLAPSNASASNVAECADPISTRNPSANLCVTTPITDS